MAESAEGLGIELPWPLRSGRLRMALAGGTRCSAASGLVTTTFGAGSAASRRSTLIRMPIASAEGIAVS
jgi:hypothetical protein